MIGFLTDSENFSGFTFNGYFMMEPSVLEKLYDYYQKTGKNLLDDYCEVKYAIWEGDPPQTDPYSNELSTLDRQSFDDFRVAVSNMRKLGLFDSETLRQVEYWAKIKHDSYKKIEERKVDERRSRASNYISKSEIRQKVFKKHGRKCLSCSSTENLTLDHVIPISRGGKDEISNLQPLCKSCNCSKGTKTIDYR